jgi:hypothetical protein
MLLVQRNFRRSGKIARFVGFAAVACSLAACSGGAGRGSQDAVAGETPVVTSDNIDETAALLVEERISDTATVGLYDTGDGEVSLKLVASVDHDMATKDALRAKSGASPLEVYTALTGKQPPASVIAAKNNPGASAEEQARIAAEAETLVQEDADTSEAPPVTRNADTDWFAERYCTFGEHHVCRHDDALSYSYSNDDRDHHVAWFNHSAILGCNMSFHAYWRKCPLFKSCYWASYDGNGWVAPRFVVTWVFEGKKNRKFTIGDNECLEPWSMAVNYCSSGTACIGLLDPVW